MGRMEWSGGGKWDNCNSIINKYIKKKDKKKRQKKKKKNTFEMRFFNLRFNFKFVITVYNFPDSFVTVNLCLTY